MQLSMPAFAPGEAWSDHVQTSDGSSIAGVAILASASTERPSTGSCVWGATAQDNLPLGFVSVAPVLAPVPSALPPVPIPPPPPEPPPAAIDLWGLTGEPNEYADTLEQSNPFLSQGELPPGVWEATATLARQQQAQMDSLAAGDLELARRLQREEEEALAAAQRQREEDTRASAHLAACLSQGAEEASGFKWRSDSDVAPPPEEDPAQPRFQAAVKPTRNSGSERKVSKATLKKQRQRQKAAAKKAAAARSSSSPNGPVATTGWAGAMGMGMGMGAATSSRAGSSSSSSWEDDSSSFPGHHLSGASSWEAFAAVPSLPHEEAEGQEQRWHTVRGSGIAAAAAPDAPPHRATAAAASNKQQRTRTRQQKPSAAQQPARGTKQQKESVTKEQSASSSSPSQSTGAGETAKHVVAPFFDPDEDVTHHRHSHTTKLVCEEDVQIVRRRMTRCSGGSSHLQPPPPQPQHWLQLEEGVAVAVDIDEATMSVTIGAETREILERAKRELSVERLTIPCAAKTFAELVGGGGGAQSKQEQRQRLEALVTEAWERCCCMVTWSQPAQHRGSKGRKSKGGKPRGGAGAACKFVVAGSHEAVGTISCSLRELIEGVKQSQKEEAEQQRASAAARKAEAEALEREKRSLAIEHAKVKMVSQHLKRAAAALAAGRPAQAVAACLEARGVGVADAEKADEIERMMKEARELEGELAVAAEAAEQAAVAAAEAAEAEAARRREAECQRQAEQQRAKAAARAELVARRRESEGGLDACGLRQRGNEAFAEAEYAEAERLYSAALCAIDIAARAVAATTAGGAATMEDEEEEWQAERVTVLSNRAASFMNQGHWLHALADTHAASQIAPGHVKVLKRRAQCHEELGLWSEAVDDYEHVVEKCGAENNAEMTRAAAAGAITRCQQQIKLEVPPNHFLALGLDSDDPDPDTNAPKKAFRRLALKFHPDKGGCERVFKVISEAHDTLADPAKRSAYEADFRMSAEERAQRQRHPFGRGRGFSTGFGMAEEFEEMMHEEMCFQEMMYMRQMFGGGGGGRQGGFRGRGGGGFPFGFGGSPFDGGAHFGFDDSDEDYRSDSDEESGGAFYFGRGGGGGRAPPHRSAQQQQQPRAGTSGSRGSARSSSGARAKASKKNRKKKKR